MKLISLLLSLFLLSLTVKAEDIAYSDPDAEAYAFANFITDPTELTRLHKWYRGLKNLNQYTNLVLMTSYRSAQGTISGASIRSMVGGVGTIVGSLTQTTNGLTFANNVANYVTYANPAQSTALTAYSIMAAFDTDQNLGLYQTLITGNDNASSRGIQVSINGSQNAGNAQWTSIYCFYSSDGTGVGIPGDETTGAGIANTRALTTGPQTFIHSFTASLRASTAAFQLPSFSSGAFGTVWNNEATLFVGRATTAARPMSGNLAFLAIWNNKALTIADQQAIRRLYNKTIGAGYIPRVNVIFEGDSITIGANTEWIYQLTLMTNASWKYVTSSRNLGLSGAQTPAMITDYSTSAAPCRVDFDYADRQYYSLMSGLNDLTASVDPNTIFNNLKTLWVRARADGFKVVACTSLYTLGMASAQITANRKILNDLIRNNRQYYDYLIDVDTIPQLADYNNTTYFQGDKTHLTSTGHFYLARKFAEVISSP